jgi:hypothetical protein
MRVDEQISLAIGISGSVLSLALPRRFALLPLAISMCTYPSVMLMPPPQLSLTPQRFIGLILLLRCIFSSSIRGQFKWRLVDTAALLYFILITVSMVMTLPKADIALNNRAGFFLSALVPFWCARFLITDRPAFYAFVKGVLWVLLPLALLGIFEMLTQWSPWDKIREFGIIKVPRGGDGWRVFLGANRPRARGPFLQYIMWGWLFGLFVALALNLWHQKRSVIPWIVPFLFLPLGMMSSIASGPMMLGLMAFGIMLCFPLRKYWKPVATTGLIVYAMLQMYSNRGPLEIMADFGMDPLSSWYRVGLVRFTLHQGGMNDHWWLGYGEVPYDYAYHDLCIHWIWLLVVHGIAGWIGFYGLMSAVGWTIWKARKLAQTIEDQWLLWSFMATILASLAAMLIVALFGETYYIYHLLLGVMANAPLLVSAVSGDRLVGVLAMLNGQKVLLRYRLKPGQQLALVRPANTRASQDQPREKAGTEA